MKVIIITGTPGTGKTTVAKRLCRKFKYRHLDVNQIVEEKGLKEGYDKKRKCYIIDEKKLSKILLEKINEFKSEQKNLAKAKFAGLVIDSHLSHYLPRKYVDMCIVTKCSLKHLEKRLKKRGYSKKKIRENLDAEIFDICRTEAHEMGHKGIVVDTTN